MKKNILFLLMSYIAYEHAELVLLDKIVALVYHPEGAAIVLLSDLRPGVDGVPRTIESEIDKHLILFQAKPFAAEVTDESVENFLAQVQKENNLSRADLEHMFEDMGLTPQKGREEIRDNQKVQMVLSRKVETKIVIDAQEVEDYYNEHEENLPTNYTIQFGFAQKDSNKDAITWDEPLVIAQNDLAADKLFIIDLPLQEISCIDETGDTVEFMRVVAQEKPKKILLQDRYKEIELLLKKTKYDQALQDYKDSLRIPATISYV